MLTAFLWYPANTPALVIDKSELDNYDLIYNDTLHELTFVYEIRERSGERNITSKKLILQDNKITEQTSSVTTYTFSDIEFLKPHKLNIDQFNNFGEFFFTEVDMNNDGYKERI